MATRKKNGKLARREFLKKVAAGGALAGSAQRMAGKEASGALRKTTQKPASQLSSSVKAGQGAGGAATASRITFPRTFSGRNLKMIAFPLGGIGTGTISLGGRGQLRDWEIFNRPDKGNTPDYCFPAIWAQAEGQKPVARVLEARIEPPYEGPSGLGSNNVPGLPRLASATFIGAYPFARIEFHDNDLPIRVSLEAFNPLVPLDVEASGWPLAVLRYRLKNPAAAPVKVGVAFSLQNPVGKEGRQANFRRAEGVAGLYMDNPFLPSADPLKGLDVPRRAGRAGSERFVLARLETHPVVGWPADILGRLHGRWRSDERLARRKPGGFDCGHAIGPSRRRNLRDLPTRLAFPQPHAGPLRLARTGGRARSPWW